MSTTTNNCIYCTKECKSSDSRPYPNSKGKERIHNKCQIKKKLSDKSSKPATAKVELKSEQSSSMSIFDRLTKEDLEAKKAESERKLSKLAELAQKSNEPSRKSLFFDLEAGVAKPHEKRGRYLNHKRLTETVARFDDNGHHEEAVGRAFDHTGKDLLTLGEDDSGEDEIEEEKKIAVKRKKHDHHEAKVEKRRSQIKIDEQNPCWFCLCSPKVEKHLIVAIGEHCYVTLAKGGLNDQHLLILPIEHIPSLNDTKANTSDLLEELEKFKSSFVAYFRDQGQGVVFFERNFRSVHWQLQVVPVSLKIIRTIECDIKSLSKSHYKNSDYIDIPPELSLFDVIPPKAPYLFWQIEPLRMKFVTKIDVKGSFFPIQIGRIILADEKILNCPDNIDWKACVKSQEEYLELIEETKSRYKEYDFT